MKLSKQQKINKEKLAALQHPGALMMLVDFMMMYEVGYGKGIDDYVTNTVAKNAARLKVQYLNEITPVVESKQMNIVDKINKQNDGIN